MLSLPLASDRMFGSTFKFNAEGNFWHHERILITIGCIMRFKRGRREKFNKQKNFAKQIDVTKKISKLFWTVSCFIDILIAKMFRNPGKCTNLSSQDNLRLNLDSMSWSSTRLIRFTCKYEIFGVDFFPLGLSCSILREAEGCSSRSGIGWWKAAGVEAYVDYNLQSYWNV